MIGQTIAHYRILEKIGEGGMGVVYKAEDTTLKRAVALKFLPVHALDDEEQRARLVREAQAAAALDHVNINTVFEIGESNGMTYMAMAFVEGESLRQRLKRGSVPLAEALAIIIQVAAGLTRAHSQGIVHRDVKPANVLVTADGIVKIVDFGLAKLAGATGLTKTDSTIGTAAYMSPEQARSEVVDHRSDIWSLGVILYEMLTGRLPFSGEHEAVVIYSILSEDYKPIGELRPDIPAGLEKIIARSLAKRVEERYTTMGEMLQDLRSLYVEGMVDPTVSVPSRSHVPPASPPERPRRRMSVPLLAGVGAVLLVLAGAVWFLRYSGGPMSDPEADAVAEGEAGSGDSVDVLALLGQLKGEMHMRLAGDPGLPVMGDTSALAVAGTADSVADSAAATDSGRAPVLAVLYLDNLSGNKEDQYIAGAITEDLIGAFSLLHDLRALTSEHVRPFRGKGADVREAGRRVGADHVLEGAVLRDKDRLRVNARLVQVSDAKLLWSERFERSMSEISPLRDEIVQAVAVAMSVALTPAEGARLAALRGTDPRAYEFSAKAKHLMAERTKSGNDEAEKLFRRALGVDADHVPSLVGLAQTYLERFELDLDRDPKWTTQALELLARARQRDSMDADYSLTNATARRRVGDYAGAMESARRAAATHPYSHRAQYQRALNAWYSGKGREASQALDSARTLKPDDAHVAVLAARIAMNSGRTTEAEQQILRALDMAPDSPEIRAAACGFFLRRGRVVQAASEAAEALRLSPNLTEAKALLGRCRLMEGKSGEAVAHLKEATEKSGNPQSLLLYGLALRIEGKSKDAERAFRKALDATNTEIQVNPHSVESAYRRLWLQCLLGEVRDPSQALASLASTMTAVPDPGIKNYMTAAIYEAAGRGADALEQLKAVVKPGGFSPAFLAADPVFSSLRDNETFRQLVAVK